MLEVACKMVHTTDRLKLSVHQFNDITVITYLMAHSLLGRALHYIAENVE